ncbi:MAG: 2-dehydropantoate 2-reductase [Alphaproteobacteria bacterium]
MDQKIAVLGTGANGSCAAADLTQAGYDVVLIDQWPEHVEAMRRDGLRISMPEEELHVTVKAHHMCDLASMNQKFDVVLLLTKAYDTRWACELIKPYLQPDGLLIGMQNAMTADDIADIVGPARTLGCVVELSSEIFTPGHVQRNTPPNKTWFGIGSLDESTADRVPEIVELLSHVGRVTISENVMSAKWMKLVINTMCLGPLAMVGLRAEEGMKLPGMRELIFKIGAEALTIGEERGYKVEPIFGLTKDDLRNTNSFLELLLDKLAADVGPMCRDCVLQDHIKGRRSEVDVINGLVVEESERVGRSAPMNAAIVDITQQIQSGTLKPDPKNLDLALEMIASAG